MALHAAGGALVCRPSSCIPQTVFRTLPVELVIGGSMGQDSATPAARLQVAPPQPATRAGARRHQSQGDARNRKTNCPPSCARWRRLRSADTALPHARQCSGTGSGGEGGGEGNYALQDFIRAQILRRWLPDMDIRGARDMPVVVRVRLLRSGVIDDVTIVDQARFHNDSAFRNMALSARNAALLASPIQLPPGRYQRVTVLTIDLDPKAVLR